MQWIRSFTPEGLIQPRLEIEWSHSSKVIKVNHTWRVVTYTDARELFLGEKIPLPRHANSLLVLRDALGIPRADALQKEKPVFNDSLATQLLKQAQDVLNENEKSKNVPAAGKKTALSIDTDIADAIDAWAGLNPARVKKDPEPKATKQKPKPSEEELIQWVWGIRSKIETAQQAGSRTKRVAGTRMIQAGLKLLRVGLSLNNVKGRLLVGWSNDEMDKLVGNKVPEPKFKSTVDEGIFLTRAGFDNIFFCGPPGCGKTTLAADIAKKLQLPFEAMPCFEELPASATFGRMTADGKYVDTAFTRIFENGGVFLFDEIFKAAPAVSVALNMALANGRFYNPAAGREMKRHPKCYILGASNSFGHGSPIYSTDQPQDPAFLDRFIGAAVKVDYNTDYELSLLEMEVK